MGNHPTKAAQAQTHIPGVRKLPLLTAKQMGFVEGVLAGKTGADAYRAAYDADNMEITTVYREATRLRRSPAIEAWIRAGHIAHLTSGVITKEEHVRELGAIRELSKEQGDLKSAVAAEHLRGKVSGFYVERSEVTIYEPAAVLAQIATMDPRIAALLAERFNIPLPALSTAAPLIDRSAELAEISPSDPPVSPAG